MYHFVLENCDNALALQFDACPMHSSFGFVHLNHQNLSTYAVFCHALLTKVNMQLLIYNECSLISSQLELFLCKSAVSAMVTASRYSICIWESNLLKLDWKGCVHYVFESFLGGGWVTKMITKWADFFEILGDLWGFCPKLPMEMLL